MRQHESILSAIALLMTIAWAGCAATIPKTGTLTSPENSVLIDFTLVGSGTVTLQNYGFGRGENAAGTEIPSVGFDPFVGLFSGTGPGAVFIDGTSDILSNCSPGCPPAGTLAIGSVPNQCGDVHRQFTDLAAGPSGTSTTYVQYVAPDGQTLVANSVDILSGAAAGSLCNSHTLAIVANVDAGHGISLRGLSGHLDCPGRSWSGSLRVSIRHFVPLWEHHRPSPQSNIRLHSDAGCARLSDGTMIETAPAGDQLTYE
jgi:hypothetical protein